ncbi:hypothetical protein [Guptibacillus spartinae]|uniref:hypothetical protein n=1 Tax=Guptibacillus spartinae TaxID=3025679 RepID=UPI00235DDD11|nr:hypothetical protein [Pseudalkalibacillus spartinae]
MKLIIITYVFACLLLLVPKSWIQEVMTVGDSTIKALEERISQTPQTPEVSIGMYISLGVMIWLALMLIFATFEKEE